MTEHQRILDHYRISPKKSLGQNFLVNDSILESIATVSDLSGKHVIEVGPGYGALTEKILAQNPASLTLVEYDPTMIDILQDRVKRGDIVPNPGTELVIHHGDVLQFSPLRESVIVANIPYYITSPILFRFLYAVEHIPEQMIILMQQEVGDKIRESRGFKGSYLSMVCAHKSPVIREVLRVGAGNFVPSPKVESSVLQFIISESSETEIQKTGPQNVGLQTAWSQTTGFTREDDTRLLDLLSLGFAHPRKLVLSNLSAGNAQKKAEFARYFAELLIPELARPADLGIEKWRMLSKKIGISQM